MISIAQGSNSLVPLCQYRFPLRSIREISMRLIGMLDSPYVRRCAISFQLLGLPFEHLSLSVTSPGLPASATS